MTKEVKALTKGIRETVFQFKEKEVNELFMFDESGTIIYCLCGSLENIKWRVLHFTYSNDVHIFIKDIYCGLVGGVHSIAYKMTGCDELIKETL